MKATLERIWFWLLVAATVHTMWPLLTSDVPLQYYWYALQIAVTR